MPDAIIAVTSLSQIPCAAKISAIALRSAGISAERDVLRREYIDSYKRSLIGHLDNTYIQYPDGSKKKLEKKN